MKYSPGRGPRMAERDSGFYVTAAGMLDGLRRGGRLVDAGVFQGRRQVRAGNSSQNSSSGGLVPTGSCGGQLWGGFQFFCLFLVLNVVRVKQVSSHTPHPSLPQVLTPLGFGSRDSRASPRASRESYPKAWLSARR